VLPAFDEERTIEEILPRVTALSMRKEVIVVDDGSADRTAAVVEALAGELPDVRLIVQPRNGGKGSAARRGIQETRGDIVVIQDADLDCDPADVPTLLAPLLTGHADAVYGTRLRGVSRSARTCSGTTRATGCSRSSRTSSTTRRSLNMEVGYEAFRGDLLRSLILVNDDFRFEPEVTAKVLRTPGVRVYEVPLSYYGRTFAEGKKITWRDGIKALGALMRFRFGPR
jgi:glycosyltransferase involved in cell wall biosynthesis